MYLIDYCSPIYYALTTVSVLCHNRAWTPEHCLLFYITLRHGVFSLARLAINSEATEPFTRTENHMKKKSRSPYIAALVLFLVGIGYIVISGISENSVYFLDVSEALAMPADELKAARLFGTVKDSEIYNEGQGVAVRFMLEDQSNKQQILPVVYKGSVPDTFKDGAEVIIEGGFTTSGEHFAAKTLMTKCPSKYQKENRV